MNPIFDYAFKKALYMAIILGLAQLCLVIVQTDDWRLIFSSVGLAALGPLGLRGGWEGMKDTNRAMEGKTIPSDVPVVSDKLEVTKVA